MPITVYTASLDDLIEFSPVFSIMFGGSVNQKFRITKTLMEFLKSLDTNPLEFLALHFGHFTFHKKITPLEIKFKEKDIWFEKTGNIHTACFTDER